MYLKVFLQPICEICCFSGLHLYPNGVGCGAWRVRGRAPVPNAVDADEEHAGDGLGLEHVPLGLAQPVQEDHLSGLDASSQGNDGSGP